MEGPNKEGWISQEYDPPKKASGGLSRIWHCGLNLGKKIAVTGIVVSAAPLALPPLVVLSALGAAFTVPIGLYLASYAATDKLMSTLLAKPNPSPPVLLQYKYVICDEVEKVEIYEENDDSREEEEVVEDDASETFKIAFGLEEEDDKIEDGSGFYLSLKDSGEPIFGKVEEGDAYEHDGEKVEEEIHEENGDLREEEEVFEDDASETFKTAFELDEDERTDDDSGFHAGVKDSGELIVDVVGEEDVYGGEKAVKERNDEDDNLREEEDVFEDNASETFKSAFGLDEKPEDDSRFHGEVIVHKVEEGDVHEYDHVGEKAEKETYEENENLREEEEVFEDDASEMFKVAFDDEIGDDSKFYMPIEDSGEVNVMAEILQGIRKAEEEMPLLVDGRDEMGEDPVEAVLLSAEVAGENDIDVEKVEEVDVLAPRVSIEDTISRVKFVDIEPEELERETKGMIESIRDEGKAETENRSHPVERSSTSHTHSEGKSGDLGPSTSEGVKMGIPVHCSTEKMPPEEETANTIIIETASAISVSDYGEEALEVLPSVSFGGAEFVVDDKQFLVPSVMEAAHVIEMADVVGPQVKFGDVEPEELERETKGMIESIRDEGKAETEYVVDSKQFLVPSERETADDFVRLRQREKRGIPIFEPMSDENKAEELKLPSETEMADVFSDSQRSSERVLVCPKKLVVRLRTADDHKAADICKEASNSNARGGTRIFVSADTRRNAAGNGVDHPEGINVFSSYGTCSGVDLNELPSYGEASAFNPIEGMNIGEDEIWKQINAMRTILGYKAAPCSSCLDELRALYVFVGIEPPASISEPTSPRDIDERLQFLMAIVGVRK